MRIADGTGGFQRCVAPRQEGGVVGLSPAGGGQVEQGFRADAIVSERQADLECLLRTRGRGSMVALSNRSSSGSSMAGRRGCFRIASTSLGPLRKGTSSSGV